MFPSPSFFSGSFIWLLQRLSLCCGFAFFTDLGSVSVVSSGCDSCESLPWEGSSLVVCLSTHGFLFISSFVWKGCRWVSASFGSKVFLVTGSSQCLRRTQSVVVTGHFLFVSSLSPSRPISSLSVSSFLLGMIISETRSVREDPSPPLRAHGACGISTSVAFLRNWLVPRVLEAAICRSSSVAFRLLFSRGFVFGQVIGIATSHLLSGWLTLPCCFWYGGLGLLSFRG